MSTTYEDHQQVIEDARAAGTWELALALLQACEDTPLFAAHQGRVIEWVAELRDLAHRTVLSPRQEVLHVLRQADALLARGAPRGAADVAREACRVAERVELPGLCDRAWLSLARCLVRLEQQEEAVTLFEQIVARDVSDEDEEPLVPGLAFLAVGEAHLFEGRYEGAYRPLDQAVALLPTVPAADRLRYDALVGLGLLDHRFGDFGAAGLRYGAAMRLAHRHASRPEQVETLLLMGSLARGCGDIAIAHEHLNLALELSGNLKPPLAYLGFPTERLRNLVGRSTAAEMVDGAVELARHCGAQGDLMGYVQLTAIAAAFIELDQGVSEARALLVEVASGLAEGGQGAGAEVIRRHLDAYI